MPKPIVSGLLLAGFLATANLPAAEGLLSRLLGDGCFGGFAGAIGDRPITLLIRRGRWYEEPTAWYYLDDTGEYDPRSNRLRFPALVLEDDGSQGDEVRLLERADETGTIIGRLTGKLSAEGEIGGEWRPDGAAVVLPFWLQKLHVLPQGRDPAFSIRIREAVLEIAGEEPLAISGAEGLVEPITDCGPDPFSLSVRRLPGPPDLYVIETEEHGGWGFTDTRDLVFVRPGAVHDPLYVASEVVRCSTTVGLGWDCDNNRVRYAYDQGVLTIVDEHDQAREIEPERYGSGGCVTVDRTLTVQRFEVGTGAYRLDKWVEIQGGKPGDCEEDEDAERTDDTSAAEAPAWARPPLQPRLFDDGLSGWLLVPAEPQTPRFRINQLPDDPALEITAALETRVSEGEEPVAAADYNGPATPLKAACWIYNRTASPERFQQRTHPPAALPDALRLPHEATPYLLGAEAIAEAAYNDGKGASWEPGGLAVRWTEDGTALMVTYEGEPLLLFDGEHCYHR
ncbi:MAG: hypothetical protein MUC77_20905, partial [Chromatiaceae bacterium]|nr:hypothetical protein [Chromatiaceae bacterium]